MAKENDYYDITLKEAHLGWGDYRYTSSRDKRSNEGYIPIPMKYAKDYSLYNSNYTLQNNLPKHKIGVNLFYVNSKDGFFNNNEYSLLAQGCSKAGNLYAKQFSIEGNLTMLGDWFTKIKALPGDKIRVLFTDSTHILLEKL